MAALIEIENIVNRFGRQIIHDGVNLVLNENEILGLVGGSGSGKSVLLRTILGLNPPQGGHIKVAGQDIYSAGPNEMFVLQRQWGVLFQSGALFSGLSVLDNIALPLREHTGLDAGTIEDIARLKLRMVGLDPDVADKKPSELSGGMSKRAGIARALALDPKILFLDEPTAGLDPIAAAAFDDLILSLRDALGLSVLIITHDLDTLVTVCDRIAVLVNKKVEAGNLDDMIESSDPWIREYFGGKRMRAALGAKG